MSSAQLSHSPSAWSIVTVFAPDGDGDGDDDGLSFSSGAGRGASLRGADADRPVAGVPLGTAMVAPDGLVASVPPEAWRPTKPPTTSVASRVRLRARPAGLVGLAPPPVVRGEASLGSAYAARGVALLTSARVRAVLVSRAGTVRAGRAERRALPAAALLVVGDWRRALLDIEASR
ncbi:hypothetical protein HC031_11315 [Planosporangium thailandense]|uniref:Uncharacterized protein n=1 Tax=Planosporangium thailandense TaxID=765197 RepID=A0ABX0XYQ4_9ACTN|nr:hypothetical protein [Planosporangium thailandense]NJC70294.1 hypothetical protein [Planosporangium thailandense]